MFEGPNTTYCASCWNQLVGHPGSNMQKYTPFSRTETYRGPDASGCRLWSTNRALFVRFRSCRQRCLVIIQSVRSPQRRLHLCHRCRNMSGLVVVALFMRMHAITVWDNLPPWSNFALDFCGGSAPDKTRRADAAPGIHTICYLQRLTASVLRMWIVATGGLAPSH